MNGPTTGVAATIAFRHRAMHDLLLRDDGRWECRGDDPQFLVETDQVVVAPAIYRIGARIEGDRVSRPCVYFDLGQGWSESTRVDLLPAGEGRWSALVELPRLAPAHRFDPSDRSCTFAFGGLECERLDDGEALVLALRHAAAADPGRAAELVDALPSLVDAHGWAGACGRLLRGEALATTEADHYRDWLARHHAFAVDDLPALGALVAALPARPLLSLLLPAVGLASDRLAACVDAVLAQAYPDFELIVAHPAAAAADHAWLEARSSRIRLLPIADDARGAADRALLDAARGALVGWLAGAPVMPVHALLAFVEAHLATPDATLLYADGDRVERDGRRLTPWFRPNWNPDLLLSTDYLSGVSIATRAALEAVGPIGDGGVPGLLLRCAMAAAPPPLHLPLLLWSQPVESDVAAGPDARLGDVAAEAAREAEGARVERVPAGLRVRWPLPEPAPKASIVVPTRDRAGLLRVCVDSVLERTTYPDFEVVVVDNQSSEAETLAYFEEIAVDPRVRVLRHDAPFNYAAINNRAVEAVDGELVVLLNNDVEVITPGWLEEMAAQALRPGVGAVGAMLYYPDDTIQHAGVVLGLGGVAGHVYSRAPRGTIGDHGRAALAQAMSAVTAACLVVRREAFLEVEGLDEGLQVAFNDVDFCLRLLARGYRNLWTPFAEFHHHESASRGAEDTPAKYARFVSEVERMLRTWGAMVADDPAYSPSLSLRHGAANVLAEPPRHGPARWLDAAAARRGRPARNEEGTR